MYKKFQWLHSDIKSWYIGHWEWGGGVRCVNFPVDSGTTVWHVFWTGSRFFCIPCFDILLIFSGTKRLGRLKNIQECSRSLILYQFLRRLKLRKERERGESYLPLIFRLRGTHVLFCFEDTFSFFSSLILLMSRDWKHFLVKRFVHVMLLAISPPHPLNLKCPHYNVLNPLPAGLQHAVQSKLFFQNLKGSNNRNKEVHSRLKESEQFLASIKRPVRR